MSPRKRKSEAAVFLCGRCGGEYRKRYIRRQRRDDKDKDPQKCSLRGLCPDCRDEILEQMKAEAAAADCVDMLTCDAGRRITRGWRMLDTRDRPADDWGYFTAVVDGYVADGVEDDPLCMEHLYDCQNY